MRWRIAISFFGDCGRDLAFARRLLGEQVEGQRKVSFIGQKRM
jgi:hypothetical protein